MKQVVTNKGRIDIIDSPIPCIEPGTVVVRVDFSCISAGTELAGLRASGKSLLAQAFEKPDRIVKAARLASRRGLRSASAAVRSQTAGGQRPTGYSAAGTVTAVGDGVEGFAIGDRVACAGNQCAHHAEYIRVPVNLVVRVPDAVSLEHASSVALGAVALQGIRRANPTLGESFSVIGLGVLGQLTVQLLRGNGCRVIGIDIDSDRIRLAKNCGMEHGLIPGQSDLVEKVYKLTDGRGVDGVIVTAATKSSNVIKQAFQMSRRRGRVVVVGDVGLNVDRKDIYAKELDFLVSCSYGPGRYDETYEEGGVDYPFGYVRWTENRNMQAYLHLIAVATVNLAPLVSSVTQLDQAAGAFSQLADGAGNSLIPILRYRQSVEAPAPDHVAEVTRVAKTACGNPIQIALIGAGAFAKSTHLPLIHELDEFHLRTVVSRSPSNAAAVATKYGAVTASTDVEQVWSDPSVDAVLIATRHDLHGPLVLKALRANKHVLVEKPLALLESELAAIEQFYATGVAPKPVLLTGFNRRFSKIMTEVRSAVSERTSPMMINYRMNAGFRPRDSWLHGPEGGGRNRGEACHIYDLFTFLTAARAVEVDYIACNPHSAHYRSDDNFVCSIRFDDGTVASLTYTALGSREYPKERMELFCDGWAATMDDYVDLRFTGLDRPGIRHRKLEKGHREGLEVFAQAIGSQEWPIPLWQQLQSTRISFAGLGQGTQCS